MWSRVVRVFGAAGSVTSPLACCAGLELGGGVVGVLRCRGDHGGRGVCAVAAGGAPDAQWSADARRRLRSAPPRQLGACAKGAVQPLLMRTTAAAIAVTACPRVVRLAPTMWTDAVAGCCACHRWLWHRGSSGRRRPTLTPCGHAMRRHDPRCTHRREVLNRPSSRAQGTAPSTVHHRRPSALLHRRPSRLASHPRALHRARTASRTQPVPRTRGSYTT